MTAKKNPLAGLAEQVLLFDGATGTQLYARGMHLNQCYDQLSLTAPELIGEIHSSYLEAGARAIQTNTFGANPARLAAHNLQDKLREINLAAVKIARQAAADKGLVAGSIGPLGIKLEPWGPTSVDEARGMFRLQAEVLAQAGVDFFILETFIHRVEIAAAFQAIREVSDSPVLALMTIAEDGRTPIGTPPEVFTRDLDRLGVDAMGLNCSVGPHSMLEAVKVMRQLTSKPLCCMPNAGIPQNVEGRNLYLCTPEYMATYARYMIQEGVQIIGGCCGTTPAHIRAMAQSIRMLQPGGHKLPEKKITPKKKEPLKPIPFGEKSGLSKALAAKEFVVSVEITPPRGCNPETLFGNIAKLKEFSVNGINIPDGPRASSRMGALPFAALLQQKLQLEAILHYTCRDRNLLAMQGDLLGAHAMGLRNLLLVTGDPPKMGEYPDATAVYDVDSIGLTNLVTRLNNGLDLGGNDLSQVTSFVVGVGVNPGAVNLAEELQRFQYKVEAGAEFAITQPVFDIPALKSFLQKIKDYQVPVIAGIWPLISYRNAQFMKNEVYGVVVPEDVMQRMQKADEEGRAAEEGIQIAAETLAEVRDLVQGVQLSAPLNRIQQVVGLMRESSLKKSSS